MVVSTVTLDTDVTRDLFENNFRQPAEQFVLTGGKASFMRREMHTAPYMAYITTQRPRSV